MVDRVRTARIDPEQWPEAIADVTGPQLVVAGPGTGKSEFLVRRAAHLVSSGAARVSEVAVLTFSRRAAASLKKRIGAQLAEADHGGGPEPSLAAIDVSTFHGFAYRLLESQLDGAVGTVLTTPEQVSLVARLLRSEDPSRWPLPFRSLLGSPTFAEEVADFLLRCRERMLSPAELAALATDRSDWRALPGFFERYEQTLRSEDRLDYGSLLWQAIDLITHGAAPLPRFVLVDEYQDTSPVQARFLAAMTAEHRNLTVAGDPYQSIYSFRGADLGNINRFPDRFRTLDGEPAKRIVLSTSHRVPAPILEAAVALTASTRLPGAAGPVRSAPHPGRVEAFVFDQQSAEAEWIASEVERLIIEQDTLPERIAVLVRTKRRLLSELSRALDRRHVPHERPGSRLVDHAMVRSVLDLALAAAPSEPADLDTGMRRVLLGPLVAAGNATERELFRSRIRSESSWSDVLRRDLSEHAAVADLLDHPAWAIDQPAHDGFWAVWSTLPAFRALVDDPDRVADRSALASFSQVLERQAERDPSVSLAGYARLVDHDDFEATPLLGVHDATSRVSLTTLHQAKGLEFDAVFIADASEGIFPDQRRRRSLLQPHLLGASGDGEEAATLRLHEEIRLAYTAMTRARSRVTWTATGAGVDDGENRPSRFLAAVSAASGAGEAGPPPEREGDPVTAQELQAHLRRLAADPDSPAVRRLAAIDTLTHPARRWQPERFAGYPAPGPDSGVVSRPLRLSPSQADAYDRCPRRYVLDRRLHLDTAGSPYADFGTLIHAVLELAESDGRPGSDGQLGGSSLSDAMDALERLMPRLRFGGPVVQRAWYRRAEALLEDLYEQWPPESRSPVALEHSLKLTIDGVEWVGVADRIERTERGGLRIIDYKTGTSTPSIAEAAESLQLGFYFLAATADEQLRAYGDVEEAELWYPAAIPRRWRYRFDPANLDLIRERLVDAASGIAAERWPPRVSRACHRCAVRLVCGAWPEGREAFVE